MYMTAEQRAIEREKRNKVLYLFVVVFVGSLFVCLLCLFVCLFVCFCYHSLGPHGLSNSSLSTPFTPSFHRFIHYHELLYIISPDNLLLV